MTETIDFARLRDEAYKLHKQGQLAAAEEKYRALLPHSPLSADVQGLLALCLFQQGRTKQAFAAWQLAFELPAPARLNWRNANNAAAAFVQTGLDQAYDFVRSVPVLAWGKGSRVAAEDVELATSLVKALQQLGRSSEIEPVFKELLSEFDATLPAAKSFIRALLDAGQAHVISSTTRQQLQDLAKRDVEALLLLAHLSFATNDIEAAETCATSAARVAPVFVTGKTSTQLYEIGVLNRPPPVLVRPMGLAEFHFGENTPAGLVNRFHDSFRFVSVFPMQTEPAKVREMGLQPAFYINNWVTAELLAIEDTMATLNAFVGQLAVKVINPPDLVVKTTRQFNAMRLADIPGLYVPRLLRVENNSGAEIATAMLLEREIGLPLILREPFQQMGREADKVDTMEQLLALLVRKRGQQLYAIAFVNNPAAPGIYRKCRAAVIGEDIIISHVHFGSDWNVHRERDEVRDREMKSQSALTGFSEKLMLDPVSVIGQDGFRTLHAIRQRLGLDLFGIDFDVMPDGRLLFFEANAAMNISFSGRLGNKDVRHRMFESLLRLFAKFAEGDDRKAAKSPA